MAVFPLIDSPCPFKGRLGEIMDGDTCRMCRRPVHDLTTMSDNDKRAFLRSCGGEVCVSYRVAASTVAALGVLAAAAAAAPAASAQTDPTEQVMWVIVGGLKGAATTELVELDVDASVPELPVVFEPAPVRKTPIKDAPIPDTQLAAGAGDTRRDLK